MSAFALLPLAPHRSPRRAGLAAALVVVIGLSTAWPVSSAPSVGQVTARAGVPQALTDRVRASVERHFQPHIASGQPSDEQAPGGILAVYVRGQRLYFPYGRIDKRGTPPTPGTVFGLASVTKVLTTSILGQQPDLFDRHVADDAPRTFKLKRALGDLTYAQLATYTGGISPSDPDNCKKNCTQRDFVAFINSRSPERLPAPNDYSNSSIGFLGQMLLARTGAKDYASAAAFQRWYDANLFKPLRMRFTSVAPGKTDRNHPLSKGFAYDERTQKYKEVSLKSWCPWGPAGRAFSTAEDMLSFAMANVGVAEIDGQPIPPKVLAGLKEAQRPRVPMPREPNNSQAFAWTVKPDAATRSSVLSKNGGLPGISSGIVINPELQLAVVALTNMAKVHAVEAAHGVMGDLMTLRGEVQ